MKKVPPQTLYHYTSGAGLRGILASNSLWFTEYKFLNDATELEYGASLALEIAQDIVHSSDLKTFRSDVESAEIYCFMTCFCEADDLLSQWRGYSKDTVGYSVGFNTNVFERDPKIELLSVLYDKSEQRKLLEGEIKAWNSSRDKDIFNRVDTSSDLLSAVFRCKNPAFSEEREWRLIYAWNGWRPGMGPLGRKFRDAGKFMVPYLER